MRVLALGAGNHQGILSSQGPRTRACHITWNTAREQLHEAGLKPILPGQLDRRDTVQRQGQTHLRFPALGAIGPGADTVCNWPDCSSSEY
jgi:hypothetical protein